MEETIRMQILKYFASLFYHFNNFQNFKNDMFSFNTTQAKYMSKKSAMIFACRPPFNNINIGT